MSERERTSSSSLEKKSSSKVPSERDRRRGLGWRSRKAMVGITDASEVEAGDEGFENRVAVDKEGKEVGLIFNNLVEEEDVE
ncbi:hypothetical protein ACFX1Q_000153 [Malus domestica]